MCADFCFSQQKPLEKVAAQVQTWDVLEEAQGTSAQHRIPQTGDSRATGILEASLFVSGSNSLSCDGLESFEQHTHSCTPSSTCAGLLNALKSGEAKGRFCASGFAEFYLSIYIYIFAHVLSAALYGP